MRVKAVYSNKSHSLIRLSETVVLANQDVVNEFYEHSASFNATGHYPFRMSSYDVEHTRMER